ncbi:hypothetical protein GTO89_14520 [Heliobacterium gestii]|uniref:O-antigen ligase-related domain-containing protein n=1 Tax=Heliomicrobium gestii TaxID=2699 RepID=A0A845LIL1_HELGE|nr:O-antigen ligase family protein [Heliomicrobium gestii]MBM7867979.1 hypothetical protein [Heliomicrobium gestii]MZP44245.1 hypothetical protein [Heliomicrobium gestii]
MTRTRLLLLSGTLSLAVAGTVTSGWGGAVVVAVLPLIALGAVLTWPIPSALPVYLVMVVFVETLKRMIFLFDPADSFIQYIPLALGQGVTLTLGLRGLAERIGAGVFDRIDKAFLFYLSTYVLGVLVNELNRPSFAIMVILYFLPPQLVFFAYRCVTEDVSLRRILRVMAGLGLFAGAYGAYQFFYGPSPIDLAWADYSRAFSIQASNVWRAYTFDEIMRPYSFFADHFSYGYFLVAAIISWFAVHWTKPSGSRLITGVFLVFSLALALTRTAWISLLLSLFVYVSLRCSGEPLRRKAAWLVIPLYAALTVLSGWAYDNFFEPEAFADGLSAQAFSLGTLSARKDAADLFIKAVPEHLVLGEGPSSGLYVLSAKLSGNLEEELENAQTDDGHNFLVHLLIAGGVPGLAAFLVFYFLCLQQALAQGQGRLWLPAVLIGLFLAGVTAGPTFFNAFFLAWCGFACHPPPKGADHEVRGTNAIDSTVYRQFPSDSVPGSAVEGAE